MKLLILGATGPTGHHIVDQALECGDTVTALARRPASLDALEGRITVVAGSAISPRSVSAAMAGQDAVISALGRGKSIRAEALFTNAAAAVIAGARETGVSRLVWLSSFGVGDTFASATGTQKLMYRTFLRNLYANKALSEKMIRASRLDWTLVYPTTLTNRPAKGSYHVDDRVEMTGTPTISRADVADFMHRAAHSREWIHRDAVITD